MFIEQLFTFFFLLDRDIHQPYLNRNDKKQDVIIMPRRIFSSNTPPKSFLRRHVVCGFEKYGAPRVVFSCNNCGRCVAYATYPVAACSIRTSNKLGDMMDCKPKGGITDSFRVHLLAIVRASKLMRSNTNEIFLPQVLVLLLSPFLHNSPTLFSSFLHFQSWT